MTAKRAGVFDQEDELDVSGFAPKAPDRPADKPEEVRAVSEAAQFQSREPRRDAAPVASAKREPRRYRTGRNMQLNIKARTDAIEAFYAIADQQGWVLGETFEHAIDALKRSLAAGQR
jgi:hypothetical protein